MCHTAITQVFWPLKTKSTEDHKDSKSLCMLGGGVGIAEHGQCHGTWNVMHIWTTKNPWIRAVLLRNRNKNIHTSSSTLSPKSRKQWWKKLLTVRRYSLNSWLAASTSSESPIFSSLSWELVQNSHPTLLKCLHDVQIVWDPSTSRDAVPKIKSKVFR